MPVNQWATCEHAQKTAENTFAACGLKEIMLAVHDRDGIVSRMLRIYQGEEQCFTRKTMDE